MWNKREEAVKNDHKACGWEVLNTGWPDFLFYKEELGKISAFFVEVKRKPKLNELATGKRKLSDDATLSPQQQKMHEILKKLGLEVKIIYKD